jgi:hypothetical protein
MVKIVESSIIVAKIVSAAGPNCMFAVRVPQTRAYYKCRVRILTSRYEVDGVVR